MYLKCFVSIFYPLTKLMPTFEKALFRGNDFTFSFSQICLKPSNGPFMTMNETIYKFVCFTVFLSFTVYSQKGYQDEIHVRVQPFPLYFSRLARYSG